MSRRHSVQSRKKAARKERQREVIQRRKANRNGRPTGDLNRLDLAIAERAGDDTRPAEESW
jgi:hypothetical protein